VNEKAERMQNSYDEMPLPTHKRQPTSHSDFNIDDIPIQSKKLTFEELLAQNLKNEDMKSEENVFGKQVKGKPKSMGYL
jgi:superfamily I DNA and RNA helicase